MKSENTEDIVKEFDAAPEIKTPLEFQTFLRASDEGLRAFAKKIAALCKVQEEWSETYIADWTLYPKDECFDVKYCPEADAIRTALEEYDALAAFNAPSPRWIFLERYSRPPVGDETIKGTKEFSAYFKKVPYVTAKMNLEPDTATAKRFAQYAEEGRYDEIEEPDAVRDFTDEGPEVTEADLPEDYVPPEERPALIINDARFRVRRRAFVEAFTRAARCVSKDGKTPAERCVKVSAEVGGIVITAANDRLVVREEIFDSDDVRVLFTGSFLVEPSELLRLFSEAPAGGEDEKLLFALHFSFLTIKGSRFRYRAFVEAGDPHVTEIFLTGKGPEYPHGKTDVMPEVPEFCEENGYYEIGSDALRRLFRRSRIGAERLSERDDFSDVVLIFKENELQTFSLNSRNHAFSQQRARLRRVAPHKANDSFSEQIERISTRTLKLAEEFLTGSERVKMAHFEGILQIQTERAFLSLQPHCNRDRYLRRFFALSTKDAPSGRLFAGDLKTALGCLRGDGKGSDDVDAALDDDERRLATVRSEASGERDPVATLELRNGRLIVSKFLRLMIPPFVETPLKYCGNRVSVALNARRLYEFVSALPPEEPVVIRVDLNKHNVLFETRDGFKFVMREAQ